MADGADFSLDQAKLDKDADRLVRGYLTAGTTAVGNTTRRLEQRVEAATQAAAGGRLWRAWQSSTFPRSGPARDPTGTLWLKGNARGRTGGAIRFWTQPGEIRGKSGQFLAIPLPSAGSRGRSRDLTPGEWERRTGQRLRFVYRPGRSSLLVADSGTLNGRTGSFRPITRARTAADAKRGWMRGEATVPIFVLLPVVKFRNAFAIEPMVNASEGELALEFFDAIRALPRN